MTTIAVVNAGMSEQSSTAHLADALERALRDLAGPGGHLDVVRVDLRPLTHAIVDALTSGFPSPALAEAQGTVAGADALIALTPTYQASYSGLFKLFFDVLDEDALRGVPTLVGATGGTPRHALVTETAMRPLFVHMHADVVTTAVYAATEDWGAPASDSDGAGGTSLGRRIRRGARELLERLDGRGPSGPGTPGRGRGESGGAGGTPPVPGDEGEGAGDDQARACPDFVDFDTLIEGAR